MMSSHSSDSLNYITTELQIHLKYYFNFHLCLSIPRTADLKYKICQQNPLESLNLFLVPGNITDQSQMEIEPIIVWT